MDFRAAEPEDLPTVRALGVPWETDPDERVAEAIAAGDPAVLRLVAVDSSGVVGYARVTLPARPRLRHLALVHLAASTPVLGPFLAYLQHVVFVRLGQLRMDVLCADRALDGALAASGFAPWIARVDGWRHDGVTADLVTWGRLADGLTAPAPAPQRVVRSVAPRLSGVVVRPVRPEDAEQWSANMKHPGVLWGTHQTGTRSTAEWRRKLAPRPGGITLAAEWEGRLVGHGSVDQLAGPRAHCMMLGISVAAEVQGLGVGDAMMHGLVDAARGFGARRVELQVYADNHRAEALYRKFGFVDEGLSPLGAWREGGWAWDRCMALTLGPAQLPEPGA